MHSAYHRLALGITGVKAQGTSADNGTDMATEGIQTNAQRPGGEPRDMRGDPYLKSMILGLIEDSYLHTGSFTQFAAEILKVVAYAVTVPVAFTEGFLRAYLSIDRIEETVEGHVKIIPKEGVPIEDIIRDVDEITAQVDPGAVFNPVVRSKLDAVHLMSSKAMKYDLNQLSRMNDQQLMDVLREMQRESERIADDDAGDDAATDYVRAKIATIRKNMRQFQAQQATVEPAPAAGVPAAGVPAAGAHTTDASATDASATDASATGASATDASATDASVTDRPADAPAAG
jgi:hypothetical protein